ncbi:MAG: hypothetical protein KJ069_05340 [Anaerolineae bacterium]|nr:hypothetical protein [Anaerolineae bacterium]
MPKLYVPTRQNTRGVFSYLGPIVWLETGVVTAVGVSLLLLSLAWVVLAQNQMGDS